MTNVLLIDLSSIAHPLWHVSASDPDPNATSTKTVERVRALASGQPHVGVCVEGGRSFRKDLDPTYKANRPESDAALYHQIALAIDILRADGFPILQAQGFEADDVIATACALLLASNREGEDIETVTIASADKDLLQLVRPDGSVVVKSLKDGSLLDTLAIQSKFNVRPEEFLDFLALCGDASDNIKGCKNVGKVTAAGLLTRFGSIDSIYVQLGKGVEVFTRALSASLEEFRPRLEAVRNLIRLRTDAPIDIADVLKERVPLDVVSFGEDEDAGVAETVDAPAVSEAGVHAELPLERAGSSPSPTHQIALVKDFEQSPVEWERQLEPRNMAQTKLVAADLFASRMFSAYGHPAGIMATILSGRELGLPMMAALRTFHIIEGKSTLAADLIRGLVIKSGVCDYFRCTERMNDRATFVAKRKGDPEISLTFTIEDGKRAWSKGDKSWEGSGWAKNPADMCVARAGSKLARLVAPDVVSGLYAPEEME